MLELQHFTEGELKGNTLITQSKSKAEPLKQRYSWYFHLSPRKILPKVFSFCWLTSTHYYSPTWTLHGCIWFSLYFRQELCITAAHPASHWAQRTRGRSVTCVQLAGRQTQGTRHLLQHLPHLRALFEGVHLVHGCVVVLHEGHELVAVIKKPHQRVVHFDLRLWKEKQRSARGSFLAGGGGRGRRARTEEGRSRGGPGNSVAASRAHRRRRGWGRARGRAGRPRRSAGSGAWSCWPAPGGGGRRRARGSGRPGGAPGVPCRGGPAAPAARRGSPRTTSARRPARRRRGRTGRRRGGGGRAARPGGGFARPWGSGCRGGARRGAAAGRRRRAAGRRRRAARGTAGPPPGAGSPPRSGTWCRSSRPARRSPPLPEAAADRQRGAAPWRQLQEEEERRGRLLQLLRDPLASLRPGSRAPAPRCLPVSCRTAR